MKNARCLIVLICVLPTILLLGCPQKAEPVFICGPESPAFIGKVASRNVALLAGNQWRAVPELGVDEFPTVLGPGHDVSSNISSIADSVNGLIYVCDSEKRALWSLDLNTMKWSTVISDVQSNDGSPEHFSLRSEKYTGGVLCNGRLFMIGDYEKVITPSGTIECNGIIEVVGNVVKPVIMDINFIWNDISAVEDRIVLHGYKDMISNRTMRIVFNSIGGTYSVSDVAPNDIMLPCTFSPSSNLNYRRVYDQLNGSRIVLINERMNVLETILPNAFVSSMPHSYTWSAGSSYIAFYTSDSKAGMRPGLYLYTLSSHKLNYVGDHIDAYCCMDTLVVVSGQMLSGENDESLGNVVVIDPETMMRTSAAGGVSNYTQNGGSCQWARVSTMSVLKNTVFCAGRFNSVGK